MAKNRNQRGKGDRRNKLVPRFPYADRVPIMADALRHEPNQSATVTRLFEVLESKQFHTPRRIAATLRQAPDECAAAGIERDGLMITLRARKPKSAPRNGKDAVRGRKKGLKRALGRTYVPAGEKAAWEKREPFAAQMDPDVIDRGRRGHQRTQDSLANLVKAHGMEPLGPNGEPQFDVAWHDGDRIYVVEVKSLTKRNEERQLRLGLGQVLRYRQLLREKEKSGDAWAVLALEREPSDKGWQRLCRELDVILWWPGAPLPTT